MNFMFKILTNYFLYPFSNFNLHHFSDIYRHFGAIKFLSASVQTLPNFEIQLLFFFLEKITNNWQHRTLQQTAQFFSSQIRLHFLFMSIVTTKMANTSRTWAVRMNFIDCSNSNRNKVIYLLFQMVNKHIPMIKFRKTPAGGMHGQLSFYKVLFL